MREALDILAPTDAVLLRFGALVDLAEVLQLAGRTEEARDALAQAGELAEIKGAPVMVAAARTRLAAATERTLAS